MNSEVRGEMAGACKEEAEHIQRHGISQSPADKFQVAPNLFCWFLCYHNLDLCNQSRM